jgi:peptide/nickel transport system substrate-binding protein
VNTGRFQLATGTWGQAHPHPHFSYVQAFLTYNQPLQGPGAGFPLVQQSEALGRELNLEEMTVQSAEGLDVDGQKQIVNNLAIAFNELLPLLPLWERYGNNPVLDGARVTGWAPAEDPIYKNSPYADSFVIMMMLEGKLRPV